MKKILFLLFSLILLTSSTLKANNCENLIDATEKGNVKQITEYLKQNQYKNMINCNDKHWHTPLHHAAEALGEQIKNKDKKRVETFLEICRVLLKNGALKNVLDKSNRTPYDLAKEPLLLRRDHLIEIEFLKSPEQKKVPEKKAKKPKPKKPKKKYKGSEELKERFLLEEAEEIPAQEKLEEFLEHIKDGKLSEIKKYKLISVNFPVDNNLNTPLHIAAKNHHQDVIEYLITQDANGKIQNIDGNTALHMLYEKRLELDDLENEQQKREALRNNLTKTFENIAQIKNDKEETAGDMLAEKLKNEEFEKGIKEKY